MGDDSKINVDIKAEVKADFQPILKKTPNAIKSICYLIYGDKLINSERKRILAAAQNEADKKNILSGKAIFSSETGKLSSSSDNNIIDIISATIKTDEVKNIIKCIVNSFDYIESANDTDETPTDDFLNRWRNEAKFISDETLQYIWGRVLSEEINEPKKISLRTLDVIKNLSKAEAEYFSQLSSYIIFGSYLLNPKINDTYLFKDELYSLRDAGLMVSFTPGQYVSYPWPTILLNGEKIYYVTNSTHIFFVYEKDVAKAPKFIAWELSKAAENIYSITLSEQANKDAVNNIIEILLKYNSLNKIYYGNWDSNNKEVTCINKILNY